MALSKWRKLLKIMARLRGPGGCPWDREQTKESLKKYIIEEAYEVLDAIDHKEPEALADELGDLLLQIVFQAQLAAEAGEFTIEDVLDKINAKLVRRHPHVFGDVTVGGARDVLHNWEIIKQREKPQRRSLLEGIPPALPALRRAARVQQRAASVGFDWSEVGPVLAKVHEETAELEAALASGNREEMACELGDLLFATVNLSRHLGVEAEDTLNAAVETFRSRFGHIEQALEAQGRSPRQATLAELDGLWNEAKRREQR
jgi:tetrapyrrole methylase family protein/MazG family protein